MHLSRYVAAHPFAALALATLLTACGGGGGGGGSSSDGSGSTSSSPSSSPSPLTPSETPSATFDTPEPMPAPDSAPAGVFISEVSSSYDSSTVNWVEIYNGSGNSIDLSHYRLRTPARYLSNSQIRSSNALFSLPQRTIPSNGYIVIAARASSDLQDTPGSVYIADSNNQIPDWQGDSGFIELQANGATVDFVAFGHNTISPASPGAWKGPNVALIPPTTSRFNTAWVRPFSQFRQTHSASDWSAVNFATPGGINDIPAGVIDSDEDGIPDSAKVSGGTYAGLNLYAMGARRGQRDLFVHVDYLASQDPGVKPTASALDKVAKAFQKQNIAVHFDTGNLFSTSRDVSKHNLSGNISHERAQAPCTLLANLSALNAGCNSLYTIKSAYIDLRRTPVFRYLLMAHSQQPNGTAGASGAAEFSGNDLLVTLGGWGLKTGSERLTNYQAATIMHELGHTLGLRHGGADDIPNKPNYYSVMNYFYQMTGLSSPTGEGITQRYYYWLTRYQNENAGGYTPSTPFPESSLEDGPASVNFTIDYSDGAGAPLDEASLQESNLIGRGSASGHFADWNLNRSADSSVISFDINRSGGISVLKDHDDWGSIVLAPRPHRLFNNNGVDTPAGACGPGS